MIELRIATLYKSVAEFCEKEGVAYQTVMNWIHGRSSPRLAARNLIRQKLGLVWDEKITTFIAPELGEPDSPVVAMLTPLREIWREIPENRRTAAILDLTRFIGEWRDRHVPVSRRRKMM